MTFGALMIEGILSLRHRETNLQSCFQRNLLRFDLLLYMESGAFTKALSVD